MIRRALALIRKFFCKQSGMEPPIRTIAQLLYDLNHSQTGRWVEVPGYVTMPTPEIKGQAVSFQAPKGGLVLKAFFNENTGEIKNYLAKVLDVPDRAALHSGE